MNDQNPTPPRDSEFPPVPLEERHERIRSGITGAVVGFATASLPGSNITLILIVIGIIAARFITDYLSQQKSRPLSQRAQYQNISSRITVAITTGGASSLAATLLTIFTP